MRFDGQPLFLVVKFSAVNGLEEGMKVDHGIRRIAIPRLRFHRAS